MNRTRIFSAALLALAAAIGGAGCTSKDGEGPAEQAGKAIDEAAEKVDEKLKDVAADTKETVKETVEETAEDVKKAVDED